jgi:hypothetical protein
MILSGKSGSAGGVAKIAQSILNHSEPTILSPNIVVNPNLWTRINPLTGDIIYGLWLVGLTTVVFYSR